MGNCSCSINRKKTFARVIDGRGISRPLHLPAKAWELMLEDPGYVIAPLNDLRRSCRVSPMKPDDDLLHGKAYVMLPTARAQCKVTEAEMARLEVAACKCKKKRRRSGGAKVLPAVSGDEPGEGGKRDNPKGMELGVPVPGCRLVDYIPRWSPGLETISEGSENHKMNKSGLLL